VLKAGETLSHDSVIAHCSAHLAAFKRPKQVFFIDGLPKNASGKVLKRDLREQFTTPPSGSQSR
jgi:fatty-acyl-CoA synthase